MSNIIPFESAALPAYLQNTDIAEINADVTGHAGSGFPVISLKGKVFAIVRDGDRKILPNPKDPESPATSIDVVLLKVNKLTSKVYYAKSYSEDAEGVKPDCFSTDGLKPDASVDEPQSKSCATCKWNEWGSKISDNNSKGKACQDSVRLAVAEPGLVNDPYLLRVPPASIRALGEYGQTLSKRGIAYNMAVTKISFDIESPTPKLVFKGVGLIDESTYAQVQEVAGSDVVSKIIGMPGTASTAPRITEKPAPEAKKPEPEPAVEKVAEKAKPAAKKAAAPEVTVEGLDLDNLNFDD